MTKFLLQLAGNELKFDVVDQHVFDNRKFAVDTKGEPRYTENYAVVDGNNLRISFNGNSSCLGGINRILGLNGNLGQSDEPTHVRFSKGRSKWIYEIATGEKWKKAA